MLEALVNCDPGDETDHVDEGCEQHPNTKMVWFDDGGPESGPQEPYLMCPDCYDEHRHPIIHCYFCNKDSKTVKTMLVNERFDPTEAYTLECGHTII